MKIKTVIENKSFEKEELINEEEEKTALNILKELEGHLIIRADKILNFCIKSLKYKKY
ncbi:hypothetical protein [Paraclostridium bifermentans]|uniref:hypothetical protein n=1 Tax=Paraclostridium bifermentans TaxID=1490 RepID=UPI0018AAE23F|nr:hypothetical protein [Paraclostridium bifermentans]